MREYRYVAIDRGGARSKGVLQAADRASFLRQLDEQGLVCVSCREKDLAKSSIANGYVMHPKELYVFCRQMHTMLRAGVQLPVGLGTLVERLPEGGQRRLYERILATIESGAPFSVALREQGKSFPPLMSRMVEAAESAGTLAETMGALADHYEKERERAARIKAATTYPIILVALTFAMILAVFTFVVPRLLPMFGDDVSGGMKVLLAISNFFVYRWYVAVLIVAGVIILDRILKTFVTVQLAFDRMKFGIPGVGRLLRTIYTSRFSAVMHSLYAAGVPLSDALRMSADTIGNAHFRLKCAEAGQELSRGSLLSAALERTGLFDSMFCTMLRVGEESGQMEDVLDRMAGFYDREGNEAMDSMLNLLQPVLIIIIAVVIGGIIVTIISSIYGMYGNLA